MIEHRSPISGIATHEGRFVLTAGYDNQVILWDAEGRRALARGCHDHLANQCSFSPDGRYAASSSSDYTARLWSVPEMQLLAVLGDHRDDVEGIAFHPVRPWVATSSRDGMVRVFDLDGALRVAMKGHLADVISVSWIDDGTQLMSSSDDGTLRRWDAESGELLQTIEFDGVETDTIALMEGGVVVAGNDNGELVVVDGESRSVHTAHEAGVKKVVYDSLTRRLVSLSYDRSVKFWGRSGGTGLELQRATTLPAVVWPRSCAFLDEERVAFVTFGSRYAVYHVGTDSWDLDGIGDTGGINAVCVHRGSTFTVGDAGVVKRDGAPVAELGSLCNFIIPFGDRIIAGGQMGRVFDAMTGQVYYQHRSPLNCAAVTRDETGPCLVIGSYTGEGIVMAEEEGNLVLSHLIQLHDNAVKGLAASGGALFSVCATAAAALHDVRSGKVLFARKDAHSKIANGCVVVPGGRYASVSRDLKLRIWADGEARIFDTPHRNSIKCCAVSADGAYIATADYGGMIAVFEVDEGRYVHQARATAAGISSIVAHPDGGFLASSYDGSLYRVPGPERHVPH